MPLAAWWNSLQQRHQYRNLEWLSEDNLGEQAIPFTLFDSIADNLIDNARNKRLREPDISVQLSLRARPLCLSVCDSGSEIAEEKAGQLLQTVVASEDGLGVGLFQVARWAEQSGYHLKLQENRKGRVCFELVEVIRDNAT